MSPQKFFGFFLRFILLGINFLVIGCSSYDTDLLGSPPPLLPAALIFGVGEGIPEDIDQYSKNLLGEAERNALDYGVAGEPVVWTNGASRGEVTAFGYFRIGSLDCRRFAHHVLDGGESYEASATACRNDVGAWELIR